MIGSDVSELPVVTSAQSVQVRYIRPRIRYKRSIDSGDRFLTGFALLWTGSTAPGPIGATSSVHDSAADGPAVVVAQTAARGRAAVRFLLRFDTGKIAVGGFTTRPVASSLGAVLSSIEGYDGDQCSHKEDEVPICHAAGRVGRPKSDAN